MNNHNNEQQIIVYEDQTVKIYKDRIQVLKYYFPIPAKKHIPLISVKSIHLRQNSQGKLWGTSPAYMDIWYALDNLRHLKKQYIEIGLQDSGVLIAFSPNQPKKVIAIIQTQSALLKGQRQQQLQRNFHQMQEQAKIEQLKEMNELNKENYDIQSPIRKKQLNELSVSKQVLRDKDNQLEEDTFQRF